MTDTTEEYEALVRNALKQPGIKEIMELYGQYDLLMQQTIEYLSVTTPKPTIVSGNTSSP